MTARSFLSVGLLASLLLNSFLLYREFWGPSPSVLDTIEMRTRGPEAGFEDFETVAFAREFSERLTTFESETFRSTQVAASFLMEDEARRNRLADIDRLAEKMRARQVVQRGRLMFLARTSKEANRFQARVQVDLLESAVEQKAVGPKSQSTYFINMDFEIMRVARSAQNPWGFLVSNVQQTVTIENLSVADRANEKLIRMTPETSVSLRFPCVIENVELPKGTSLRVRLTTLDVSEVQLRTEKSLESEQQITAICRDHAFRVKVAAMSNQTDRLVALKVFTFDDAEKLSLGTAKRKKPKSAVERSIEEQLGFVIEAD